MTEKVYKLTKDGYKQIERKLKTLRTTGRAEIAERIRQAKEFGQLEENAEYESAKSEQTKLEQEITKLEKILRSAQILDKKETATDMVDLGTVVTVKYLEDGRTLDFEVVSTQESNPGHKPPRISDESPLGSALLNRRRGDVVEVEIPLGKVQYEVLDIINAPG